jgi:serpin B
MKKLLWLLLAFTTTQLTARAATNDIAASAINQLGLDLLHQTKTEQNTVLSPYSIQSAMAMAYEGADGTTRTEMAKVLHYPGRDEIRDSLNSLRKSLDQIATNSKAQVQREQQQSHVTSDPIVLSTANRLFGQTGYDFRPTFLSLLKNSYAAPFEALDFKTRPGAAAKHINQWVETQTHDRIRDLIPASSLNETTRLVLVNAIYLKAPWLEPFEKSATKPKPFHLLSGKTTDVPTMTEQHKFSFAAFGDYVAIALPYQPRDLQMLIIFPKRQDQLGALEQKLTAGALADCANLPMRDVIVHLPKFKLEPSLFRLKDQFTKLGMKEAFDIPKRSANFDRIAPRKPDAYLYISDIFHKPFVDVDEKGTEAAAATAVIMMHATSAMREPSKPVEVRIDHPFLFAIQHRETGACLFLGRVTDPTRN